MATTTDLSSSSGTSAGATACGRTSTPSSDLFVETDSEESSFGDDDQKTTGERDTTTSEASSSTVVSLLERLKAPKKSELTRKRKIFTNPREHGMRKKRPSCSSNPKSVTPSQRVKEFPNECLTVSARTLFCEACRQEVSLRRCIVKNHIASSRHLKMKDSLKERKGRDVDIAKSLKQYDEEQHPSGECLPEKQRIYRIKVLSSFLKAGVPLNKIDSFRDVFEEGGYRLACRRTMSDHIPFIRSQEISLIKDEIAQKNVGVIFDGTTRLGEALAIVVRFVDDWEVKQRLIRLQLLTKTMTGEEIARELVHTISTEYDVSGDRLVATMRDRASANGVAMRTLKVLFPYVLDVGCYSHTLDHIGEHFDVPNLEDFTRLWISLFSHSPRTRLEWKNETGKAMASYSETRWWSRWEVYHQILVQFGDVTPFLEKHNEIAPITRTKLLDLLHDARKKAFLQMELAAVVDAGEPFVKSTYTLEGDGPLVFKCYDHIQILKAGIDNPHYPNVTAIAENLSTREHSAQQWTQYAAKCVKPGIDYFKSKFCSDESQLKDTLDAFKAARLFVPHRLVEMSADTTAIDSLSAFPFLNHHTLNNLKQEFTTYVALAQDVSPDYDTLSWWKGHSHDLPYWSAAAQNVILVQPSSATSERVFSLLKASFGPQQDCSLQDYVESSLMLQFNKR